MIQVNPRDWNFCQDRSFVQNVCYWEAVPMNCLYPITPPTLSCTEAQEHSIRKYTIEPIQKDRVINWANIDNRPKDFSLSCHQSYSLCRKPKSKIATTPSTNKRRSTPKTARVRNRKEYWYRDICSGDHPQTLLV